MIKKVLAATTAFTLAVSTVAYAASPTVFPHGISANANIVTGAGVSQGTVGETATTAAGAVQANGGDASKTVVTPTGDTASQALSDVAAQATGSVQKTAIGAANGVAPLDTNKMMSAAVSGDASMAPAKMLYGVTARTIADARADRQDVRDYGYVGTAAAATADKTAIQSAVTAAWSNDLHLSPHQGLLWPDSTWTPDPTHAGAWGPRIIGDGYIQNIPSFSIDGHTTVVNFGNYMPSFTANDTTGNVERGFVFSQVDGDGQAYHWPVEISSVNDNSTNTSSYQGDVLHKTVLILSGSTSRSKGEMDGLTQAFYSDGLNGGGAYDVVHHPVMLKYGNNWAWMWNPELHEVGGWNCGDDTWSGGSTVGGCASVIGEMDIYPAGPELSRSHYDSSSGARSFLDISGTPSKNPSWSSGTSFSPYQMIDVVNSADSKTYLYEATGTAGTTGSTEPSWTFDETALTDGTVTWKCLGVKRAQVSKAIGLVGGVEFGTFLETEANAPIYNAVEDFSQTAWTSDAGTHVIRRQPVNSYTDMSADGTEAGKNKHLWGLSTAYGNHLVYSVNGSEIFSVLDAGDVKLTSTLYLGVKTKAAILALASPVEGQKVFDSDDHEEVTYRCPTTSTCGWFPVQYGTALSN